MESDFGPQPFIFCNNLADRKQRVAKSKEQEQGSGDEQTSDAGEGSAEGEGVEGESTNGGENSVVGEQAENENLEYKDKGTGVSQDVNIHALTTDEAQNFISDMELSANEAPEIDLTIENWDRLFGTSGIVNTPIGDVKMGDNQFAKMMRQGRNGKLGMIKPTLENPHAIIEEASKAKEGDTTERASSYIFIRSFKKADGSRYYYFTSITVSKDGKEVVVSSQEKNRNKILRLLQEGNVIWRTPKDATTFSAKRQGLDYEQVDKAETAAKGSEITPQSTPSADKGTNKSETLQEGAEKNDKKPIDKINEHRATEGLEEVSEEEVALRDALNEQLKKSGIDVVTDVENGERVLAMAEDNDVKENKVYHGSGTDFDEFDHSHIGEGEGAQAFGWGTYLTEVKGIGEGYAKKMGKYPQKRALKEAMRDERMYEKSLVDAKAELLDSKNFAEAKKQEYENLKAQAEQIKSEYGEKSIEYDNFVFDNDLDRAERQWKIAEESAKRNEADIEHFEQKLQETKQKVSEAQAEYDKETEGHKSVLYTVEIPDDNGKNFLHWESQTPSETVEKIRNYVREHCSEEVAEEFDKQIAYGTDNPDLAEYGQNGENVYKAVEYALGSDKKASLVLSELGMQGISYPADFMRGGRADGARNYVIFKEEDAKITDKVRFFKTKNGKAYGFTVGGKIYVDPRIAKADTPIHEYSHLWASMFRDVNPKEWSNVVKLMKDSPLWEEIRKKYPELKTDEEIADEVLAHFSGKRGAERLRQAQQEAMKEKGVSAKASAISAIERVRKALSTFWKGVCDLLHIHFTNAEEVADRVLSDMLNGVDPMKVKKGEGNLHYRMGDSAQTFAERQRTAVENRGIVMPGLNEAEVKVVEVPKHSYKGTIKEATEQAIESAKAKYVPDGEPKILHYNNYGTSFDYEISKTAIQICLSPTHQSKSVNKGSHLALADHLDEIINNSIEVEEHPDYTKDENGVRGNEINSNTLMHRFYGAVTIDGKQYPVMTLMRENQNLEENNGIHSYKVQTIEVLNNELPSTSNGVRSESITTIPSTSVTKLLQGVEKSYDKGKKLLEESKSLTDIKYRTSSEIDAEYPSTSATDPESKTNRATEISEHLNTPVRVITSEKEMEGLSPRQKKAKGWYNTATGEVVVVVSNNADVADVENTVLHEVIGHDGIRDFRL